MQIETISARRAVDNAFLQESITKTEFETFRRRLLKLLNQADEAVEDGESEEHLKGLIKPFLNNTNFEEKYYINTKKDQDLAIYNGKSKKTDVGVIIEAKKPSNRSQMITKADVNKKGFQQSIFYYLRERIDNGNEDIRYVIVTDVYNWYVFDAQDFERHFYKSKKLRGWYQEWKQGQKVSSSTQFVYDHLSDFIDELDATIKAAKLNVKKYRKLLEKEELSRDEQKKLVPVFKFFTPTHLLKLPFASDSNELNKGFYRELLYIMGLKEYKEKGTHYITRLDEENRQHASLIENTVTQLKSLNVLSQLPNRKEYGDDEDEQLFNVAIQLLITWINRILFLKLLEAQLYKYHQEDERFRFLSHRDIAEYDGLNKLFFQVLAVHGDERSDRINTHFGHIPYLNSSLFDVADIERQTIRISELEDGLQMPVYNRSKIRNRDGERLKGEKLSALEYLLRFLDAYNFNTEGTAEVQEETKTLINASVLGRIFEKINGYKDGSFFTPGYITEYMCRETIRRAVVQKFNEACEDWDCEDIEDVSNKIARHEVPYDKANEIVNSITICDPAVGSGHFLVSALNELIAIKSDLRIFVDENDQRIRDVEISVDNDELSISAGQDPFFEYRVHHSWKDDNSIERTVGPDTQRLQKALFREKNILIENCLFGVDINPNSVNICRLRLWIELLKHAYYKEETDFQQLEVLPNIDINIKQGNSLVSRFDLDADLSQILANNEDLTIEEYKQAVRSYKETGDREDKRALKEQIKSIKDNFEAGLKEQHEVRQELKKQEEILIREETKLDLFEGEKKSKKEQKKIKKTKKKIGKLEEELEELENASFYDRAFEWRFEFPEVLDEDGNFTGFDAVIGNPPYGVDFPESLNDYLKERFETNTWRGESYVAFSEMGLELLKEFGQLTFIIPDTLLNLGFTSSLRNHFLDESRLNEVVLLPTAVFESATVDTIILGAEKRFEHNVKPSEKVQVKFYSKDSTIENVYQAEKEFEVPVKYWQEIGGFNVYSTENEIELIIKLDSYNRFDEIASAYSGIKGYEVGKGAPPQTKEIRETKPFTSETKKTDEWSPFYDGKHVGRYENYWDKDNWIKYGEWLAAPRKPEIFEGEKILARKIVSDRLIATYIPGKSYCNTLLFIIKIHDESYSYKFLLGILNSLITGWYYRKKFQINPEDTFPQILIRDINQLPVPVVDSKISHQIESHVDQILTAKEEDPEADTSKLENEIDQLVYVLYGLSKEEIGIVEESI